MKNISLRITSLMEEDRVPPRCGNLKISPAEEDSILNSVENARSKNSFCFINFPFFVFVDF